MYYVKRLAQMLFVFMSALTLTFVLYRMLPHGPTDMMRAQLIQEMVASGEGVSDAQMRRVDNLVEVYTGINPDQPLHIAYFDYLQGIILYQDFGESIFRNEPVFDVLFRAMPWSIFISFYGLVLGTTTSLLIGAGMAYTEGSRFDTGMTVFTVLNTTIPYYVVAIITLIVFSFGLGWFPSGGRMASGTEPGFNLPFMIGAVEHAALPIFSSFVAGFGGALAYRGNCVREMGKGYLRVARLRGVSQGRLAIRYVGRNALLPIYTGLMMGIAGIFGSSIILEVIFNYPAMGYVTFDALMNRDFPLVMGSFIFFTTVTLIGLLIADLTYGIIDPRVKTGDEREAF